MEVPDDAVVWALAIRMWRSAPSEEAMLLTQQRCRARTPFWLITSRFADQADGESASAARRC